ncbi:aspartic peptidase domain-containing protein [Suillus spraguei]|nr:aspartic peptidase domain-containing protein [Suillus spraguei]
MSLAASFLILSLALRLNFPNGTISNFLQRDKARVAALRGYNAHGQRAENVPVTNSHFDWTVQVGVGNPPTTYNLVVDSGSSITWVGASKTYVKTVTSVPTGIAVRERSGAGNFQVASFFQGMIYRDTFTLGEDGYFGIGPRALSVLSMPLAPHDTIPTFTDGLYDQYNALQPLNFHIEGRLFSLTPNAQIWPRSSPRFNPTLDPDNIYLVVMDLGLPTGTGLDFSIGYTFMQRFYTVLNGSRQRIGFAPTQFTDATTN